MVMVGCSPDPTGNPASLGLMTKTWRGILISRCAGNDSRHSMINSPPLTASNIPTPKPSDPVGPVKPSTCTPASRPCSPSSCGSRCRTLINKWPSEPALHVGQHHFSRLLFQHVIPGFRPSPESYAPAVRALDSAGELSSVPACETPDTWTSGPP